MTSPEHPIPSRENSKLSKIQKTSDVIKQLMRKVLY
jgi:hypothetical protein